jgi:hypothetical protein
MTRATLLAACLAALGLVAAGCWSVPPATGWDGTEDCSSNNPPAIGNVEINSIEIPTEEPTDDDDSATVALYTLSVHFDWVDPGVPGAEDPPNLIAGGYWSGEIFGYDVPDILFNRDNLESTCGVPAEGDTSPCAVFGHSSAGCSSGSTEGCTQGEFTIPFTEDFGGFPGDEEVVMEFRIRDACGGTSNEKSATYLPGTGLAVEQSDDE